LRATEATIGYAAGNHGTWPKTRHFTFCAVIIRVVTFGNQATVGNYREARNWPHRCKTPGANA